MFVELEKIVNVDVQLKNESLFKELNAIKRCEREEYLLSKGTDRIDLKFEGTPEIVSINLDNVLYIKPMESEFKWGFVANDERLMLPFTEVTFKGGDYIFVTETYEALKEKFNKATSE